MTSPNDRLDPVESRSKVALVAAYFWPERLGCATYMTDLALDIVRRGLPIEVFAAEPHYPRKSAFQGHQPPLPGGDGFAIRRLRAFDRSSGAVLARLINDAAFSIQVALALAFSSFRPAAIFALAPTVLSLPAARIGGHRGRLIAVVHDIESGLARTIGFARRRMVSRLIESVEALCLNQSDAVIVLTEAMRDELLRIGVRKPISVIPLWCSIEQSPPVRRVRPPTVMYSGALSLKHGVDLLPRLWAALRVRVPDARLIVQGDGGEHERVIADLRRIGGNIDLRDSVEISGLAASLAEADLQLVLQAESAVAFNLPSKALSAAAAGVPFLTNAPAGSPVAKFAADSGGGWVVPRGDAAEMADAAAALLADPGRLLSMATSGLAFVRRNHERTRLIDRYLELSLAADA